MKKMTTVRKKLIEVDIPLDSINAESKREKSIRYGHPSTLHLWWSRKPLAACRAVIFASLVDDPSSCPDEFPTKEKQDVERKRLHDIISKMIIWENTDEKQADSRQIQHEARYEIARSVARMYGESSPTDPDKVLNYLSSKAPSICDPFAGGGSIPLEAQRLGLGTVASDLNPVAVLINKALVDLPAKVVNMPPVNPDAYDVSANTPWSGTTGLASDVRYYGNLMIAEAFKRIGHLYPEVTLPNGRKTTVIAWLWTRTVPCPNPACGIMIPLMTQFQLSTKPKNLHWIKPVIDKKNNAVSFKVQNNSSGVPNKGAVSKGGVTCMSCHNSFLLSYVREQSKLGNIGKQMTAIVATGTRNRIFLSPTQKHTHIAISATPNLDLVPQQKMPKIDMSLRVKGYGITHWNELFTNRQLSMLSTFVDILPNIRAKILEQCKDQKYADVVCTYLALMVGKLADSHSSYATYLLPRENVRNVFARQAIPMVWDFAEGNPFANAAGTLSLILDKIARVVDALPVNSTRAIVKQANASSDIYSDNKNSVIVTDPPYYDNISYGELSDFFYVWLRLLLRDIHSDLFTSMLTPANDEMIAAPRFKNPSERFEKLMGKTLQLVRKHSNPNFPTSVFYAYKQQEKDQKGIASTGWDTMLSALVDAGFQIVGTWPMRTEFSGRSNALSANSLASSIILVCRVRPDDAPVVTRRDLVDALRAEMPLALARLQAGNIAPVDLAQAVIGPGMSVFTKYGKVLDIQGNAVSVRDALALINETLDELLAEREGDFDRDTRWALAWFEQSGFNVSNFGAAETLSKAKNTSVKGVVDAGILNSDAGKVRLIPPSELSEGWDPKKDKRFTVWEATHYMLRALEQHGEAGAADLMVKLGSAAEPARDLTYRLYHICEQKKYAQEAQSYNALVQSWPEITRLAREAVSKQALTSKEGMKQYDDR